MSWKHIYSQQHPCYKWPSGEKNCVADMAL